MGQEGSKFNHYGDSIKESAIPAFAGGTGNHENLPIGRRLLPACRFELRFYLLASKPVNLRIAIVDGMERKRLRYKDLIA